MLDRSTDFSILADRGFPIEHLDAGEKAFLEQDAGDFLYVVISGTIEIVTFGKHLEHVGPGGMFGEIALIDDGPRSASALALQDSKVMKIDRAAFLELVRDHPIFSLHVMQAMAQRLRRTTSG